MAKGQFPSDRLDQYMLRFPDGMRDRIKTAAEASGRSMNAEIVERLEESFAFPQKEAKLRREIAEINQETESADQEILELKEKIKYREDREIEHIAEIKRLRTRLQTNDKYQDSDNAEIAALRSELGEVHQILRNYMAHSERLQDMNERIEKLTKGLVVYGRAFELSHDGDQARALDILDKAIDDVEKQERREKDTPEKKAG